MGARESGADALILAMELRFLAPGFALLLLLALLPWVGPFATRDRRHAALRSALFVLLALALARPARVIPAALTHEVLVLDRSLSVRDTADAAGVAAARRFAAERGARARRTVIEVGAGPLGSARAALTLPDKVEHLVLGDEHNSTLGAALAAAARAIAPGARGAIEVHTDGLATEAVDASAAAHAAADLAARGIEVRWHLDAGAPGDLRPVGLTPVGNLRVGQESVVEARLLGGGQVITCRLLVRPAADPAADSSKALAAGEWLEVDRQEGVRVEGDTRVALRLEPQAAGFQEVALEVDVVEGLDPRPGDTRLERTFGVQDPLRVLYLGERMQGGRAALAELVGGGFEWVHPSGAPGDGSLADGALHTAALAGIDLVLLDDRPAASVPLPFQEALVTAVARGGLGLVCAGGEAAFGPGGYHNTPLETLLPVEFVQKEEKRDPSTTLVVIIDTSGSMGGQRVQLAKEVSRLAIRRLLPHDKVGMVEFYGAKRWAVPIQPASNSIEIERALNRLDAGGGTVILPAIEEAYYGLKNVRTRYKHVLILTDGGVETGAFEPLLRRMADEGMNVSTVLIGGDAHSEFLVTLANWGQGRFYSVPNRFNLPEILLKQPASAKLPAYRSGSVAVRARGGAAWFGDVDPESLPPVEGYVETRARPGAERILETAAEGHPLLASWRYGLGRVTALMTEPTGPGSASWRAGSDYGDWLARTLERTAADNGAPFVFQLQRDGDEALLIAERRAEAVQRSAEPVPLAELTSLTDATGSWATGPWVLERVASDRFEARLPLAPDAGLRVECRVAWPERESGARSAPTRLTLEPLAGAARERQAPPEARAALETLLARRPAVTAGAVESAEPAFLRLREYRPLLAFLALLVYLLDILYRRWPQSFRADRSRPFES